MNYKECRPNNSQPPNSPDTTLPSHFTFEEFADQPEYQQVNRELVARLFTFNSNPFLHVDVATGTGLIPKLIIENAQKTGRKGSIFGIDPNSVSLDIAKRTTPFSDSVQVEYLLGFGQQLQQILSGKIPSEGVDSLSIHDALHEIEGEKDKREVLVAMVSVLKPGGVLSFNSAFATYGVKAENSEVKWGRWKMSALRLLEGQRDKNVEPIKIYTPDQYKEMIEFVGLRVIHEDYPVVHLSQKALAAISKYPKFVEGVFGDMIGQENFSLQEKSEALIKALENVQSIPRGWYEVVAQKPL